MRLRGGLALVAVVVAVLLTGASASAAVSASPCVFVPEAASSCASTNPVASLDFLNQSDTEGCTFAVTIDWGDGSAPEHVTEAGGEPGPTYLASHGYATPGSYKISVTGAVTSGGCRVAGSSYAFTLAPPGAAAPATPTLGQDVVLTPVSGTVAYRVPGAAGFALLETVVVVPNGTDVDAIAGVVRVTVDTGGSPVTEDAVVWAGYFIVDQATSAPYETVFTLSEPLIGCTQAAAADKAGGHARAKQRKLWVHDSGGSFGTTGKYVATTVEGTHWLTSDSCTSSSVVVAQGTVAVHDLVDGQTVVVSAHHHYTAAKNEPPAGPLAAVDSYWGAIGAHEYALAYGYVLPGATIPKPEFLATERRAGIESVAFQGRVTAQSTNAATIAVVSLTTRDHEYGCRRWSGSYRMTRRTGRWLIAAANIAHRPC